MDFLTLCQRTAREAGISGTGPALVTGQTGQLANVINWVNLAWKDIQNLPYKWKFQWDEYSVVTIASNPTIGMDGETVDSYATDTFSCYLTATGTTDRQKIKYMGYQAFKKRYPRELQSTADRPTVVTELPGGDLKFYPTPDAVYTIEFEGYKKPQDLTAGTDVPVLPEKFHEIIIFKALIDHGRYEDAVEIRQDVPRRFERMLQDLLWDQVDDPHNVGDQMVVVPQ